MEVPKPLNALDTTRSVVSKTMYNLRDASIMILAAWIFMAMSAAVTARPILSGILLLVLVIGSLLMWFRKGRSHPSFRFEISSSEAVSIDYDQQSKVLLPERLLGSTHSTNLRDLLINHGAVAGVEETSLDTKSLSINLEALRKSNLRAVHLLVALSVLLLSAGILVIVRIGSSHITIGAIAAGMLWTLAPIVLWMAAKVWREQVQTSMILMLVPRLKPQELLSLLKAVLGS